MHCLVIICKYFSLSHKPDYQRSRFKYLSICFTVSTGFRFDEAKKITSRANSDDKADQMTERNNDNTLGILRADQMTNETMIIRLGFLEQI